MINVTEFHGTQNEAQKRIERLCTLIHWQALRERELGKGNIEKVQIYLRILSATIAANKMFPFTLKRLSYGSKYEYFQEVDKLSNAIMDYCINLDKILSRKS
jgi:hypothetical protein